MRFRPARRLETAPVVTVVIPHYNYGAYLPTAVRSVLEQDVPVEVIIVDDASTDGSIDAARTIAASDPRITLIEHAVNQRHIRTYNDGLGRATGDYVVLLSADDALAPGSLGRSVALLESDPRIALVYGRVEYFEDRVPAPREARAWSTIWEGEDWIELMARRGRNIPTNPEVVMRRSVFESIGGYSAALPRSADMLMWLQAAARGRVARVNGPTQAYYRHHAANMHKAVYGGLLDDARSVHEAFDLFFQLDGARLPRGPQNASRARRSVARETALSAAALPSGAETHLARRELLGLARAIEPRVTRSAAWHWAGLADRLGGRARSITTAPVESLRWRGRSWIYDELGL